MSCTPSDTRLLSGDWVEVKSREAIFKTLDARGCLEGLPFMPEMLQYCGHQFRVWRRVEKTCVEGDRVRRMKNIVFLGDLRCDGAAHGGCEKECRIFWHEAWLDRVDPNTPPGVTAAADGASGFPYPVTADPQRYICQSTELLRATHPLSKADLRQYYRDLRYGTWHFRKMTRFVCVALGLRVRAVLFGLGSVKLRGNRQTTPTEDLNLQPGEYAEVKSRAEIAATLDARGRNRGLEFPIYMLPFSGRRFRVRKPVRRLIQETTGEMREIKNSVTLECVTCDGYGRWGGCPRDAFHLWREVWLRRVPHLRADASDTTERQPAPRPRATVAALRIESDPVDPATWDQFVALHPLGSIYHLSGWQRALEKTFPHIRGHLLVLRDNAHGVRAGVIAYVVNSWLLGNRLICAPLASTCDPLVQTDDDLDALAPHLEELMRSTKAQRVEIKAARLSKTNWGDLRFVPSESYKEHYLTLPQDPTELLRRCSRTNVRQRIHRAEAAGVAIEHPQDKSGLATFYHLVCATRKRLGLPMVEWRFLENLWEYLGPHAVRVSCAVQNGRVVSGLLVLCYKQTCTFEYAGDAPEGRATGANQLLWWENIRRACMEGYRVVSLGRTSPSDQSLIAYKRHWGATEEDLTTFVHVRGGRSRVSLARQAKGVTLIRWLFRYAPRPVYHALSHYIYRHWG